jgi:hypothetical protein
MQISTGTGGEGRAIPGAYAFMNMPEYSNNDHYLH